MILLYNKYKYTLVYCVLTLCSMLLISTIYSYIFPSRSNNHDCPYIKWHGGTPTMFQPGSCFCGVDSYCMCTPSLAIDCIIEYRQDRSKATGDHIILVWRKDPPRDIFAIPGGFVSVGETAESAVIREVKEETNLTAVHLEQFKLYSDPSRDKRRHTASMVYRCIIDGDDIQYLHRGDDAKAVKLIPLSTVLSLNLAFDHQTIIREYIKKFHPHLLIG